MKKTLTLLMIALSFSALTVSIVNAEKPEGPYKGDQFLCPIVGEGVAKNGRGLHDDVIYPPAGTSFLPGKNQAGAHANMNAWNKIGPPIADNNPGHNPDFSPIWNTAE